jgi:hypothetical protein
MMRANRSLLVGANYPRLKVNAPSSGGRRLRTS